MIVIYSEKPGYRRWGRPWSHDVLVQVKDFSGQRPAATEGAKFVITPKEFAELKSRAATTPLKYREPDAAITERSKSEFEIATLHAQHAALAAKVKEAAGKLAEIEKKIATAAIELDRMNKSVAEREADLEALTESAQAGSDDRRGHRRKNG